MAVTSSNQALEDFVSRIEKLNYDKDEITGWLREVYAEVKASGYDPKILRKVVAIRKKDRAKLAEEEALLDTYMGALGMLADLPLGQAAIAREQGRW